jgi:hypothetical protein
MSKVVYTEKDGYMFKVDVVWARIRTPTDYISHGFRPDRRLIPNDALLEGL